MVLLVVSARHLYELVRLDVGGTKAREKAANREATQCWVLQQPTRLVFDQHASGKYF